MSESQQLIENQRTRNPHAREERLSRRLAERVGVRLLARGGARYAEAVIEGLGDPSKAWMTCSTCKRPYVQEWAVREMGHAMNRAMGNPQVAIQIAALIGAEPDVAKLAVGAYQQVNHLDDAGRAAVCLEAARAYHEPQGSWRSVLLAELSRIGMIEPGGVDGSANGGGVQPEGNGNGNG